VVQRDDLLVRAVRFLRFRGGYAFVASLAGDDYPVRGSRLTLLFSSLL
jgi:hypothetical protein